MAQPTYDATLKDLVRQFPRDRVQWVTESEPVGEVKVVDPELSTVSADSDLAIEADGELFHYEFQSSPMVGLSRRMYRDNALLHHKFNLPVLSVLVLLRKQANLTELTGVLSYTVRKRRVSFEYEVIRLWEIPVEELLAAGPGLLPLVVLGKLPEGRSPDEAMPEMVSNLHKRAKEVTSGEATKTVVASAFFLAGRAFKDAEAVQRWFQEGFGEMEDSSTYQWVLEQGAARERVDAMRECVLRGGTHRFGVPSRTYKTKLEKITDRDRLERLFDRLFTVDSWKSLLTEPDGK